MTWVRGSHRAAGLALATAVTCATACSSISTVRVQPESLHAPAGYKPIAIVHAQVTSAYFLFLALPGKVNLDYVVNRMLLPAAKALGADKVVDVKVDITPGDGIWTLRKLIGWRSAEASGVAVVADPVQQPAATNGPAPTK